MRPPFSVDEIRLEKGSPFKKKFSCPDTPAPVRDLNLKTYYEAGDPTHSFIDEEAHVEHEAARAGLRNFENLIVNQANLYVSTNPPREDIAACGLRILNDWAQEGGLLGTMSSNAVHVRKWSLGIIAASYLQVKNSPALGLAQKQEIESWISSLAAQVITDYARNKEDASRNNNHLNWAAYAVAMAAAALDDREYYNWALDAARRGIDQIDADGTMKLEMARGQRALHYHIFALNPLIAAAEIALANGDDLYVYDRHALNRAADRVLSGLDDPSYFAARSGYDQDVSLVYNPSTLAWLELYHRHSDDARVEEWLARLRPMRQTRLGGNTTLLYGGR